MPRKHRKNPPEIPAPVRIVPTRDEMRKVGDMLAAAPPIVAAIMGASLVEYDIEALLRKRIPRKDDATWKEPTKHNAPLSGLSNKIALGYAFRLYDANFMALLHVVRNVRNQFAHSKTPLTFKDPFIVSQLRKVTPYGSRRSPLHMMLEGASTFIDDAPQMTFALLCNTLVLQMWGKDIAEKGKNLSQREKRLLKRVRPPSLTGLFGLSPNPKYLQLAGLLGPHPQTADPSNSAPAPDPQTPSGSKPK